MPEADGALRPLLVGYSDAQGGAARATHRLHRSLHGIGVPSVFAVRQRTIRDDPTIVAREGRLANITLRARRKFDAAGLRLQSPGEPTFRSLNSLPSRWAVDLEADVVNLHWVGSNSLSVGDIGRIKSPTIFTLHDMWAFCGTEHYASDDDRARWITGYRRADRPTAAKGLDLDAWNYRRKRRSWRPTTVVCPSRWLADCASRSELMRNWDVRVIPNPVDTAVFAPADRAESRRRLGLPEDEDIVLFGAMNATSDVRKGFDLLRATLEHLRDRPRIRAVVFGADHGHHEVLPGLQTTWLGQVADDDLLATVYSCADVMVVPSRQDNAPQTAIEAMACGTPVAAFRTSGLPDFVVHGETGLLAVPFDPMSLADAITTILDAPGLARTLGHQARARAEANWGMDNVAGQYLRLYESVYEAARS